MLQNLNRALTRAPTWVVTGPPFSIGPLALQRAAPRKHHNPRAVDARSGQPAVNVDDQKMRERLAGSIGVAVMTDDAVPEAHKGLHGFLYGESDAAVHDKSARYGFRKASESVTQAPGTEYMGNALRWGSDEACECREPRGQCRECQLMRRAQHVVYRCMERCRAVLSPCPVHTRTGVHSVKAAQPLYWQLNQSVHMRYMAAVERRMQAPGLGAAIPFVEVALNMQHASCALQLLTSLLTGHGLDMAAPSYLATDALCTNCTLWDFNLCVEYIQKSIAKSPQWSHGRPERHPRSLGLLCNNPT